MEISRPGDSSGSNFQQQGTVDWTQLGARTVTFSLDVLSRLASANVDSYTFEVGRVISSQFELSAQGRENFEAALKKLYSYRIPGTVLWFGFGVRHVVRQLATTHQGLTCVALCGVLAEYFQEDVAAEILFELVKLQRPPPGMYTPSILQWKSLIQACEVLPHSSFGSQLDELLQLNPLMWDINRPAGEGARYEHFSASPKRIAKVLQSIAKISSAKMVSICVVGREDIGWLAAISEWLFGLRVMVENADGKKLYSNFDNQIFQSQATFRYAQDENQDESRQTYTHSSGIFTYCPDLQIASQTFVLDDTDQLFSILNQSIPRHCGSGRLPWDRLLSGTFWEDFTSLITHYSQPLVTLLRCFAQLMLGYAEGDAHISTGHPNTFWHLKPRSYGHGLILTICERLPEVGVLRGLTEDFPERSSVETNKVYRAELSKLKVLCGCYFCQRLFTMGGRSRRFCWVGIVHSICQLGLQLSLTDIFPGLFPKRRGIEIFYRQQTNFNDDLFQDESDESFKHFLSIIETRERYRNFLRPEENILSSTMTLFTGESTEIPDEVSAFCANGIVDYLQTLKEPNDSAEDIGKVFVGVGGIELDGRQYSKIEDYYMKDAFKAESVLQSMKDYDGYKMVVQEKIDGLKMCFQLEASKNHALPPLHIAPRKLMEEVIKMRTRKVEFPCRKNSCREIVSIEQAAQGGLIDTPNAFIQIVRGERISHIAAIKVVSSIIGDMHGVLLPKGDCLQCHLNAIFEEQSVEKFPQYSDGRKPTIVVIKQG